jgi:hypothetical protein
MPRAARVAPGGEEDEHFLAVARYVERNAQRAGLVSRAEGWPWGSLWQRCRNAGTARIPLTTIPDLSRFLLPYGRFLSSSSTALCRANWRNMLASPVRPGCFTTASVWRRSSRTGRAAGPSSSRERAA